MWALIILAYILFFVLGHYAVNRIKKGVEDGEPTQALPETLD